MARGSGRAGETPESTGKKGDHLVGDYYVRFAREVDEEYRCCYPEALPAEEDEKVCRAALPRPRKRTVPGLPRPCRVPGRPGDPDVVALWKQMNGWVYNGFDQTYRRLGVAFDRIYRESQTYSQGREIVLSALERGLSTRLPDGAVEVQPHSGTASIRKPSFAATAPHSTSPRTSAPRSAVSRNGTRTACTTLWRRSRSTTSSCSSRSSRGFGYAWAERAATSATAWSTCLRAR